MELYKKLGFNSEYEFELYEDVCCELNNINGLSEKEDILKLLRRLNNIKVYKKEDYDAFMENKGLIDLFNKVKGMSYLDRYVELYLYHSNLYAFHNNLTKMYLAQAATEESKEDVEFIIKCVNAATDENNKSLVQLHCVKYIMNKVDLKIPFMRDMFYNSILPIHRKIFLNSNGDEDQQKLN